MKYDSAFSYYLNQDAEEDSMWIDSNDSLANPVIVMGQSIQYMDDTVYNFSYSDLSTGNNLITEREYSYVFQENDKDSTKLRKAVWRIYYNGHDIFSFSITARVNIDATRFDLYKNDFFNSIVLN